MKGLSVKPPKDYSVDAGSVEEHLKNSLMMLGGLKRALAATGLKDRDADAMLEGITRRIGLALDQLAHLPRGMR